MCYSWLLFGVGPCLLTLFFDVSIFIARPMFGFVKYILLKYSQPQLISSVISIDFIFAQSTKILVRGRVSVRKSKDVCLFHFNLFLYYFFCILNFSSIFNFNFLAHTHVIGRTSAQFMWIRSHETFNFCSKHFVPFSRHTFLLPFLLIIQTVFLFHFSIINT